MNLRLFRPGFAVWSAVQADIDRITEIWRECLTDMEGAVAVRREADDRGCDVCAGRHPVP